MEATKRCPFCAEEILVEAIRCKHCQADLGSASAGGAHQAIGLALLAVPVVVAVLEWNVVHGESLLEQPDRTVAGACGIAVAVTALLAAAEASMFGLGRVAPGEQSRRESPPLVWFAGLLLLWPVTFPWYFAVRKRLGQRGMVGAAVLVAVLFVTTGAVLLHQIESAKAEVREALAGVPGIDPGRPARDAPPKPSAVRPRPTWQETKTPSPRDDVPRVVVSRESDEAIMGSDGQDLFPQIVIRASRGRPTPTSTPRCC